jgi:hypothetical protein
MTRRRRTPPPGGEPRAFYTAGGLQFRRMLAPRVLGCPVYTVEIAGRRWQVERFEPRPVRQWRALDGDTVIEAATLEELAARLQGGD